MRTQYKVLSEKYSLVHETKSDSAKVLVDNLLNATTFDEFIKTIQTNPLFVHVVVILNINNAAGYLKIAEVLREHQYLQSLPPSQDYFPADALIYGAITDGMRYAALRLMQERFPLTHGRPSNEVAWKISAEVAWGIWWRYYEPIKKAGDEIRDASKKADINLDI